MIIEAAYLAWVVVALALFRFCQPAAAALGSYLGGWILLPVGIYPSGSAEALFPYWLIGLALPSDMGLGKAWVAPASALLGVLVFDPGALRRLRPVWLDVPVVLWCLWPLVAGAFAAAPRPLPALASLYLTACWGLPWLLGRLYFSGPAGQLLLARGLVLSGLACLPFSLFEGLFGPRLHGVFYGAHPFREDGAVRYLGFRPIGFFEHGNQFGLWVALSALAAVWLARSAPPPGRTTWRLAAALLVTMAVAAQSVGALLLLAGGVAALWACERVRPRALIASATALLVMGGTVYVSGVVPLERIARETAIGQEVVGALRAVGRGSFTWRVARDQKLMRAAMAHPATGSAQWDWWRASGTRPWGLSVLVLGQFGIIGLVLAFGTLLGPAFSAAWQAPGGLNAWRLEGVALLLATLVLLGVLDALLNAFLFFPALLAAGGLAAARGGAATLDRAAGAGEGAAAAPPAR